TTTGIDFGLLHPDAKRFCRTADLRGNRTDRFPARPVTRLVLEQHPNRTLTNFRRIPALSSHDSILSKNGASGKPGAVHSWAEPKHWTSMRTDRTRLATASRTEASSSTTYTIGCSSLTLAFSIPERGGPDRRTVRSGPLGLRFRIPACASASLLRAERRERRGLAVRHFGAERNRRRVGGVGGTPGLPQVPAPEAQPGAAPHA